MGIAHFLTDGIVAEATRLLGEDAPQPPKRHASEGKGRGLQTPESLAKRDATMIERYGSTSISRPNPYLTAKMVLSNWFPDPDVPGVRMRILRGT